MTTISKGSGEMMAGVVEALDTGESLPGASIFYTHDSTIGAAAGSDGSFSLPYLPGKTVEIRILGFNTVHTPSWQGVKLISLSPASYDLDGVEIIGERDLPPEESRKPWLILALGAAFVLFSGK